MVADSCVLRFFPRMSDTLHSDEPPRESIAPRHESLTKEFHGEVGPRPLEYGEARLWLVARDPRWVFAYWQFNPAEHPEAIDDSGHARFFLRIFARDGSVETETDIQPDNGNIYLPVSEPDSAYTAELGFFSRSGIWCFITKSGVAYTPPSEVSPVIPFPAHRHTVEKNIPAAAGRIRIQRLSEWTEIQERLFVRLLTADALAGHPPEGRTARARAAMARTAKKQIPEAMLASLDIQAESCNLETPSSFLPPKNVPALSLNAELIFHGATDHDATLFVAGEKAQLRHDGTFRVHCRMPDGEYEIPIVVRSADGKRERRAVLKFSRETEGDFTTAPSPDYLPERPPAN